jgi:mxaK protein
MMMRGDKSHPSLSRRLFGVLYAARMVFIWLLLAAGVGLMLVSGWNWYANWRDNRIVTALLAGENVEIDPNTASSNVLFARAFYLLRRDHIDEAQVLLDQANFRGSPETRVSMLYDVANTRLRATFDAIERGEFDKATAIVGLVKDDYTAALRLDPQAWDVKYNLDVAARLVRDLPVVESTEEPTQELPQQLWTDLPGTPKGGP